MDENSPRIRVARLDDIEATQSIERVAGRLFDVIGLHDGAAHPPLEREVRAPYVRIGQAWIAEVNSHLRGYTLADAVDGHGHLEQISVDPSFGGRGLGRALI